MFFENIIGKRLSGKKGDQKGDSRNLAERLGKQQKSGKFKKSKKFIRDDLVSSQPGNGFRRTEFDSSSQSLSPSAKWAF